MPLKVVHQGKETVIEDDATALIGSDASSEIRIVRPGISRRHAVVSFDGTGWKIEDAGSRNGTFVNGSRITVSMIDGSTTAFLGHPTDGEQVTFVPQGEADADTTPSGADIEEFDLPATPPRSTSTAATAATATTAATTTRKPPAAKPATTATPGSATAPTRVQAATPPSAAAAAPSLPGATPSASDVELAQLTAAIRDQIKAVKGLTWSVWAMIAVTAALIVLTLFVGILSN